MAQVAARLHHSISIMAGSLSDFELRRLFLG
jgi:hypothetical protein